MQGESSGLKEEALRIFRGLARSYDRTVDWATLFQDRKWKRWASEQMEPRRDALVLDIGCGTLLMQERMRASGCEFVGLDLTEEMIRGGQSKRLEYVSLLRGDAESLPFHHGVFDSAVSCYVPKYVRMGRLAEELKRVIKEGGTVVLYDFVKPRGPLSPIIQVYIQAGLRAAGFLLALAGSTQAHTFRALPAIVEGTSWDSDVVRAMERAGFETGVSRRLTGGTVFAYCGRKRRSGRRGPVGGD